MSFNQDEYISQATLKEHSTEFIEITVEYAKNLSRQELPVIFSTYHLSIILDIPFDELSYMIENPHFFYKYYQIKKRNGKGFRQIVSPFNTLRIIQQYINQEILSKIPVSEKANGFVKGKSILDNALPHKNKKAILNIDLLKFFDSISEHRVYGVFESLGYAKNLSVDLAKLVTVGLPQEYLETFTQKELKAYREIVPTYSRVLPQGAPTSPTISNLILRRLDKRLSKLSETLKVDYSRYADDITFSGELDNLPKIRLLRHIIREEGFNINWKKVGIYRKGRKQVVTGLTVSNDVHIHRNFKKDVKKHIYGCINFGVENHLKFMQIEDKHLYKEWLLGKIYFINSIEPETAKKIMIEFNKITWII
ncbi:MAG: reverse transcriptase domain-containing protein [Flavobacterium nitrogenifigens]|uniref:reverse transcriptase domain-containing protein n=1 Tax=Flavobacterium nitrogenifigens TaxID=1617283 RepID=UPI002808BDBB|nr:reverse transcriptase domain-containing protein [Flavobacterium nitrogenifigens]MDQ8011388.1 reverse transcriptase domain-containing protein [Flavobacterium nitrogenifigens]